MLQTMMLSGILSVLLGGASFAEWNYILPSCNGATYDMHYNDRETPLASNSQDVNHLIQKFWPNPGPSSVKIIMLQITASVYVHMNGGNW